MTTTKPKSWCFVKEGGALVPDMDMDAEALENIANGERVKITITQWRNNDRLRAYWGLLRDCVNSCGLDMPTDTLSQVIKLETGYVDVVKLPGDELVRIPRSISFEKMTESDFVNFFRAAEKFLAETYGYAREIAA